MNLIPYRVFRAMKILDEDVVKDQAPIKGIGGTIVPIEGKVKLLLTLGVPPLARTQYAQFLVVKLPLVYNAILGRPFLYDFEVATSIWYLCRKFSTKGRVATVKGR